MLYEVVLAFESVDEISKCGHLSVQVKTRSLYIYANTITWICITVNGLNPGVTS